MFIIKSYWKTIGWALLVLLISAWSGEKLNKIGFLHIHNIDKVIHFLMYFIFTFLMINDINNSKRKTFNYVQIILFSVVFTILYGGSMELLQSITKLHRTSDFFDFLANAAGSLTAVFLYKPIATVLNKLVAAVIKPPQNGFL
jgi:VanZ family protein